jgi:hypothetical protein
MLYSAYDGEAVSLEKYIQNKTFEVNAEWNELGRKLAETKERLKLALELEELQKKKAEAENDKLQKGNSITYQVLMFEQDWSKSRLGVLQIKLGILEILAGMKLFEDKDY